MEFLFFIISLMIAYAIGKQRGREEERRVTSGEQPEKVAPTDHVEEVLYTDQPAEPAIISQPEAKATKSSKSVLQTELKLDSASVLLYFGAFLLIAGVGLFVGLTDFDGMLKTFSVALVALAFYGGGLYLHPRNKRLQPAAIAFVAIGLIMLPLVGVAAYSYVFEESGSQVWFATSVVSLGFYLLALYRIRQSFMGYLLVFMGLSMWLSIVSVVEVPLYGFAWAMIFLAMAYLVLARFGRTWKELHEPLNVSAAIFVPTAVVMSLLFGGESIPLTHQGITMGLGGLFYLLAYKLEPVTSNREVYYCLGYLLLPFAAATIVYGERNDLVLSALVLQVATLIALMLVMVAEKTLTKNLITSSSMFTAGLQTVAAVTCVYMGEWQWATAVVAINLVGHGAAVYRWRTLDHAALFVLNSLYLPVLVGLYASLPAWPVEWIVAWYVALGLAFMAVSRRVMAQNSAYRPLALAAYGTALASAWLLSLTATGWTPSVTSLIVAAAMYFSAYYERQATLVAIGCFGIVVAAFQTLSLHDNLSPITMTTTLCAVSVTYYALGWLQKQESYREIWAVCGLIAAYAGSLVGLTINGVDAPYWEAITAVSLAGGLTAVEGYRRKEKVAIYFGIAVLIAAFELLCYKLEFREYQWYWYLWAAYSLIMAHRETAQIAIYVTAGLTLVGSLVGLQQHDLFEAEQIVWVTMTWATTWYVAGRILCSSTTSGYLGRAWVYAGIAGYFLAAIFAMMSGSGGGGPTAVAGAVSLMAAGATLTYESYLLANRMGTYVSSAIVMAGLQWLIYVQGVHETQVYTHLWAGYFAALAYDAHLRKRLEDKKSLTVLALIVLTVPLAYQALLGDTSYGFLLLAEGVGLVLLGLLMQYRLVTNWGLVVAVGSVLYQLREYQFFVLVLLGLGVIAMAVYLLAKRESKG